MERNVQKNGLVDLAAALVIFVAAFGVTTYANSLAGLAASLFLGLGVLVAFASWFQMRLEENERLEKLEVEELARRRGETTLFQTKEGEIFPAQRVREQFEKFFVPGFSVLLLLLEGGGAWLLWRWISQTTGGMAPDRAMPALALFGIFALVLFLVGRFSVTIARLEQHRLLRPGASFLLAGAYICFVTALGIAGVKTEFPRIDAYLARVLCVLLGLMAVENLMTLLLEIYRPRVKGKVARPLYDSRLVGLLAQPESLFTTAAQALDYQFGFKVSETWFFQLLKQSLPVLLLAQLAALLLSTCVVIIDPGEQGVLEHFGRRLPDHRSVLEPGAHFKWPWPVDKVYRYRTGQIQTFNIGFTPNAQSQAAPVILWSVAHPGIKEVNFLVGNQEPTTITNQTGNNNNLLKVAPLGLIDISIPVQYQVTNVLDWAYHIADPTNLLQDVATRTVTHYLAGADLNAVLSQARVEAAQVLRQRIQADASRHRLGVKILFVGVQDLHPPVKVAADYENVVAATQKKIALTNAAVAEAIQTNALAEAQAFADVNQAQAGRQQTELAAFARADLFTNQIAAYEAAPSVYRQRAYFQMFPEATANSRKYILLVTNTHDVLIFDLEDKIREDLLNLNVPSTNSP
ncbi:MAG TPA: protease modulator HflK [Verrucomicrobiae bacterium]|nr:protease modulator HflK [Verrucomicrobiae bacterium]